MVADGCRFIGRAAPPTAVPTGAAPPGAGPAAGPPRLTGKTSGTSKLYRFTGTRAAVATPKQLQLQSMVAAAQV